jgi:hypothetical protein
VAIAGRVNDAQTGKPIPDAEVVITVMPKAFKTRLEGASKQFGVRWAAMSQRLDKTRTRPDGLFHFLNLPDGKYTLDVSVPRLGKRYGSLTETASVTRDADGNVKVAFIPFALQPTAVSGKITGTGQRSGVAMAEVRMKGSGERVFSDARGQYLLAGIEPGKRTVVVVAQGYRVSSQTITVKVAGEAKNVDFNLVRETS